MAGEDHQWRASQVRMPMLGQPWWSAQEEVRCVKAAMSNCAIMLLVNSPGQISFAKLARIWYGSSLTSWAACLTAKLLQYILNSSVVPWVQIDIH